MGNLSMFDLTGKVIVITGASKGIGKGIALSLARAGAKLVLLARSEDELTQTEREIREIGSESLAISIDLTAIPCISGCVETIINHFGKIDILINNAGLLIPKPVLEITEVDWDRVMDINLKSVFFLSKEVGKHMIKNKSGKIINMSSQMAFVGYFNRSIYSTSKGGVTQLTKALAIEWSPYNITVNAIAPTATETQMTKELYKDPKILNEIKKHIPLGRIGQIEDLLGAFHFLCSESSNFMTGQTIIVDGGWTSI
ncbi:glucose 1-dehydrogenase [Bacillus sp. JJ1533]|uniref:SDR family NAD(P)-dependent oxidoreductase n=1 Tax=Bacillus sp. JJ1533 TaxID=3122959 RepID=UPI002FFD600E